MVGLESKEIVQVLWWCYAKVDRVVWSLWLYFARNFTRFQFSIFVLFFFSFFFFFVVFRFHFWREFLAKRRTFERFGAKAVLKKRERAAPH